eukprot:gene10245-11298_t
MLEIDNNNLLRVNCEDCCTSGFLSLLVIDWVMRKTTEGERTGIRWDFTTILKDIDFVDALIYSAMNHLQQKTAGVEENAAKVRLKRNDKKCKVTKAKSEMDEKLKVRENGVEEVDFYWPLSY